MYDLYTANTPNGQKPTILLEELNLPYSVRLIDLSMGENSKAEFVKLSPNSKIPVLHDQDSGITVFESGVILSYLAEKTGQFMPTALRGRYEVQEWLMLQMASVGPIFGQLFHFKKSASEKVPYAIDRFTNEAKRLLRVLDRQLEGRDYLCGDYSIADMAHYPWVKNGDGVDLGLASFPQVTRWLGTMADRPSVQRGLQVAARGK